ncbi:MAG: 3-hydroxyacyl-CoA dehydrogenase family protein, partial [Firmicutes bacterium]|nr:3-hydroxyacyl-CoA dehydrogenase family protein [Bacillota bacterium]
MKLEDVKKVVIAGAGTMGLAAAQIMAEYGYETVLWNHREPTLEKAKE